MDDFYSGQVCIWDLHGYVQDEMIFYHTSVGR